MATKKKPKHLHKKAGAPTTYKPEYAEQARNYCLLGAINEDLCKFFGGDKPLSTSTLANWMKVHPEFANAIREGRDAADAKVAAALYHRAVGYSHEAVKIFMSREGKIVTAGYTEHYAPDGKSAEFWLKNRRPEQWKEKQEIEVSKGITVKVQGEEEE